MPFPVTPSITPSNTPTASVTPSVSPTNTPTGTICPGLTPTATSTTVLPTNTPTVSPTSTSTPQVTPTPSITSSPTSTVTTPTMTPTNTATPSQTPSPPACKCYQFFNETATNGLNMYYYKCGEGFESSETLNGGQIKYRCVNSAFVPYADAGVTVTECSSVTACTVDTDCNLCT